MIKQSLVTIIACVISMGATAQDKLLAEYNNEIEPFYKTINGNKMLIQPLVDKELKGETLTKKDFDRNFFIECNTLINIDKINDTSNRSK